MRIANNPVVNGVGTDPRLITTLASNGAYLGCYLWVVSLYVYAS